MSQVRQAKERAMSESNPKITRTQEKIRKQTVLDTLTGVHQELLKHRTKERQTTLYKSMNKYLKRAIRDADGKITCDLDELMERLGLDQEFHQN
jgi:hypothetical protein